MMHLVLKGFNEAKTERRHEEGETADLSHIPDIADLIANGTVIEAVQIDPIIPSAWVEAAVERSEESD